MSHVIDKQGGRRGEGDWLDVFGYFYIVANILYKDNFIPKLKSKVAIYISTSFKLFRLNKTMNFISVILVIKYQDLCVCVCVWLCVPKDLANRWTDMVLL